MLDKTRLVYRPFEYPEAYEYFLKQNQAHWLHTEVSMATDIQDWSQKLSGAEKNVVGAVLKGFTQSEVIISDYWSTQVSKWFKIPEIQMMARAFGGMEGVHTAAYAQLNDSLGLDDFSAFLKDPASSAKIEHLIGVQGSTKAEIAKSLAIFSAYTEGVQLFSSFAVLMNFSRWNKLKGVGQIVAFSVRDESLHSEAGCWLFRQFIKENQHLWTDKLKKELYDAARLTVFLEDNFIDKAFELGDIEGLTSHQLKQFIRYRCNTKLHDLDLKDNWKNVDKQAIEEMAWFDYMTTGVEHQDFFAQRVSSYSKGTVDFDNIFDVVDGSRDTDT